MQITIPPPLYLTEIFTAALVPESSTEPLPITINPPVVGNGNVISNVPVSLLKANCPITSKDTSTFLYDDVQLVMEKYARLKCEKLLEIVAEKATLEKADDYGDYDDPTAKYEKKGITVFYKNSYGHGDCSYEAVRIDKDSILNCVDLDGFVS